VLVDLDTFAAYLGTNIAADNSHLHAALLAAQQAVEAICGRTFDEPTNPLPSATPRVYAPCGDVVWIDDLAVSTGIVVVEHGVTLAATDYQTEPLNQLGDDRRYRPISALRRVAGDYPTGWETRGRVATVTVTSQYWGWTTTPDAIKQAVMIGAKDLVHQRETRFGVAGFGEFGVTRIRENPDVARICRPYMRHEITVGMA
jgi:hypothetical protein